MPNRYMLPPLPGYATIVTRAWPNPEAYCDDCMRWNGGCINIEYGVGDDTKATKTRTVCRECAMLDDPRMVLAMLRGSK